MRQVLWVVLLALFCPKEVNGRNVNKNADTLRLSLAGVWKMAEEHSRALKISDQEVRISHEEVKDLVMERLPEIGLSGSYERASNIPIYDKGLLKAPSYHEVIRNLYRLSGDFYFNIYNGNKLNLHIREEKTRHEIALIRRDETASGIRYRAAALYLELQKLFVFSGLITQDIAEKDKQLQEVKAFRREGTALGNDVLKAEFDLSNRKLLQVQIENDIRIATQKLNILIGEPDATVLVPDKMEDSLQAMPGTYEDYLKEAFEHSFSYHISEQKVHLSELHLRQVRANVRPKIGLTGEFYYMNPQIFLFPYNPYWYSLGLAGLKASFPVSALYHNIHKQRAARFEIEKEHEAHREEEDNIRQQVNEVYLTYREELVAIEVSRVNVARAEENARIMKQNYFNQTALITDLLDADVQVLQARFELASARIEAQNQYYLLRYITGKL
ncbi:MAG: TolC family protein [Bacteroidia bacterium]|nr:TolC family protein [Bacteroidia bacterium]